MKALTVLQPFASAIVSGPKTGENRTWQPTPGQLQRGDWLAIHAGKRFYPMSYLAVRDFMAFWPEGPEFSDLPVSAFLGIAKVEKFVSVVSESPDPWYSGPVIWQFSERIALPKPIPWNGAQGLWTVPEEVEAELWKLIGEDV